MARGGGGTFDTKVRFEEHCKFTLVGHLKVQRDLEVKREGWLVSKGGQCVVENNSVADMPWEE